jgi:hypothetical protein
VNEPSEGSRHESVAGVLGVGFALLAIVVLAGSLFFQRTRTLAPDEVFAGWFAPAELPFELELVEAARQPGGETLLRLAHPKAPPEAERIEVPKPVEVAKAPGDAAPVAAKPFDWRAIPQGPAGSAPVEALFVSWPGKAARQQLEALFGGGARPAGNEMSDQGGGNVDPFANLGPAGGRLVLRAGTLPWGAFEAPFVVERKFESGGTFVDTLRVNLSTKTESLALFLRWPRGFPASNERAEELLKHLERAPVAQDS